MHLEREQTDTEDQGRRKRKHKRRRKRRHGGNEAGGKERREGWDVSARTREGEKEENGESKT